MAFLDIATRLLALPTAPSREHWVIAEIDRVLDEVAAVAGGALHVQRDAWGNTFARLRRGNPARCVAFVAHTDHPGFVVRGIDGRRVALTFEGNVDDGYFEGGRIRLFRSPGDAGVAATVTAMGPYDFAAHGRAGEALADEDPACAILGMWDLPAVEVRDGLLHSRGIDDVAGCAMVLEALAQAAGREGDADFLAVFTRGEEHGFRGALLIAEDPASRALLPTDAWVVSVETSSARPTPPIGGGAILRVGDSETIFDPEITRALHDISLELKAAGVAPLRRALMDGGCCEATIFNLWGWRCGAVCVPLGNYHNMGQAAGRIGAEFIAIADAEALSRAMAELACHTSTGEPASARLKKKLQVLADGAAEKIGRWAEPA